MKKQYIIISAIVAIILLCVLLSGGTAADGVKFEPTKDDVVSKSYKKTFLKIFVENSGSMNGYFCDGAEIKDAIKSYVSSLAPNFDELQFSYINKGIVLSAHKDVKSFVADLTPSSLARAKKGKGDLGNTDMGDLIEMVVKEANDSTVVLFISDCILDIPTDPTKHLVDKQIDITNALKPFVKHGKNSVEIIRLMSVFNGMYYEKSTNDKKENVVSLSNKKRPYYIWVLGPSAKLAELNTEAPMDKIAHGVENWISFSPELGTLPFDITNTFGGSPKKLKADREGNRRFLIHVNLSKLLMPEKELLSTANYKFKKKGFVTIEKVEKKDDDPKYTHTIHVLVEKKAKASKMELIFVRDKSLPDWVEKFNDDTGEDINSNLEKTTGIKYLVKGVADAYEKTKKLGVINFEMINN